MPVLIIFFKGKFAGRGELDLGINIESMPTISGFRDAGYMKDNKIKYSILLSRLNYSEDLIRQIIKLI